MAQKGALVPDQLSRNPRGTVGILKANRISPLLNAALLGGP